MKVSELIRRLQLELDLRGDLKVSYENDDCNGYVSIKEIGFEEAGECEIVIR